MFSKNIICGECGENPAYVRCAKCSYPICNGPEPKGGCAEKLGGGAVKYPTCPICGSEEWTGTKHFEYKK